MPFQRYVALGDSFTEGVGDHDPTLPNGVRGWADRVAAVLGAGDDSFGYANLALRGRKMMPILEEQITPALEMSPDLVSMYAGANDVLRPRVDIDRLVEAYDAAIGRLVAAGATVLLFTAYDPGGSPIFGALRGRFAIYNELVRQIADTHGVTLVDFWRLREYRDDRMWDTDRMHMSSAGHQRMAAVVLNALGVEHQLESPTMTASAALSAKQRVAANVEWATTHAGPWVKRRVTGVSSGDGLSPRWPTLTPMQAPQRER